MPSPRWGVRSCPLFSSVPASGAGPSRSILLTQKLEESPPLQAQALPRLESCPLPLPQGPHPTEGPITRLEPFSQPINIVLPRPPGGAPSPTPHGCRYRVSISPRGCLLHPPPPLIQLLNCQQEPLFLLNPKDLFRSCLDLLFLDLRPPLEPLTRQPSRHTSTCLYSRSSGFLPPPSGCCFLFSSAGASSAPRCGAHRRPHRPRACSSSAVLQM